MLARQFLIIVACLAAGCSGLLSSSGAAPVETAETVIQHLEETGAVWPGYWSDQEAFLIYEPDAEAERRLLSAALAATDPDEVRRLARTYLAVRGDRLRRLPERARQIEERAERIEGSAELVGYQAAAAALDRPPERVPGAIRQLLETPLRKYTGDIRQRAYRWRLYATGAAIGLLLDRVGPGDGRKRMEAGATFSPLLAEAVGSGPREESTLAHQARERFGYDELVREVEGLWGSFEVASVDDFYRSAPARVVISFASLDFLKETEAFFRGDFYVVGEKLTWIEADVYTAELDGFSLTIRNRDVLQDGVRGRVTVAVPELPSHPRTDGAADVRLPRIELRGRGIALTIERPVELTASRDSLHISVLVAP